MYVFLRFSKYRPGANYIKIGTGIPAIFSHDINSTKHKVINCTDLYHLLSITGTKIQNFRMLNIFSIKLLTVLQLNKIITAGVNYSL